MSKSYRGLVCWITGGGSGLGRGLALEMAKRGADVAVSGRRADRLEETVSTIRQGGGRALGVPCDVVDEGQVERALERILKEYGKLDVVVANAGFGVAAPFERITAEQWRKQMDVNVVGVAITLNRCLGELKKSRGRAAVVSSVMGKIALAGSSPYCASKFALVGLCSALQLELHGTGVSLTNILPGLVESEIALVDNDQRLRADRKDPRPQKLIWKTDRAAKVMADAILRRDREYTFTAHGKLGAFLGQHFPGFSYWALARAGVRGRG